MGLHLDEERRVSGLQERGLFLIDSRAEQKRAKTGQRLSDRGSE